MNNSKETMNRRYLEKCIQSNSVIKPQIVGVEA